MMAVWIVTGIVLICSIIFLLFWLLVLRYRETTDDAYVNGNMIRITPQIEGIVTKIYVDNTQLVEEGQPILELDRHDYEIALDGSKAELGNAVRDVVKMFIRVRELEASRDVAKSDLLRTSWDYNHRQALVGDGSVSREDFEHSETAFYGAYAHLREVDQQLSGARAEVEDTTVETHPMVEQAKADYRKAYLALYRTLVRSPARGIITQRAAQVGQWTNASDLLMALVPLDQIWVDANYREVQLKNLRIGQTVVMFADMYGREQKFHGKIVGLNPGTGSVFSILPPQNASGNWIKIIQRIPVKISFNPEELRQHPLVLGLSMTVRTSTEDRSGLRLPQCLPAQPIYETEIYQDELNGVAQTIDQIIAENNTLHANS